MSKKMFKANPQSMILRTGLQSQLVIEENVNKAYKRMKSLSEGVKIQSIYSASRFGKKLKGEKRDPLAHRKSKSFTYVSNSSGTNPK